MNVDERDEPPLPEAMWNLLREDEPQPRAVRAAYVRFLARRPAPVSVFVLLRWLAAGFALGWGVAFAATGDPLFGAGLRGSGGVEAPRAPSSHVRGGASHAPSSAPVPVELVAPEPSGSALRIEKSAPSSVFSSGSDTKWQRAATALKALDYDAAETALRELETGGAPGDRDAASLAVAQVLLTRGRVVEARARLEHLSTAASSSLVREKATALLRALRSNGDRSSEKPSVPQ